MYLEMKQFFIFLVALLAFSFPVYAITPDEVNAKYAYVVDFKTGAVLLAKDENTRMPTASMSKVMTMYMVFDALKAGRLKLDDTLPVSKKAWGMQGSKMFVHVGDQVRVEDLIRGVIIQSGNDATIVLAEGLAGSEDAFVAAMNQKAQALGMKDSHFKNVSGWPDPDHYSTAYDLTILAKALIYDFPEYYKYYSEQEYTYHNIKQGNRNPILYRNVGGDGIKTGHTEEAGYGLIGSGLRDGRRVVFVLAGMKSMQERADESSRVLSWSLGSFMNLTPFAGGRPAGQAKVSFGQNLTVPMVVGQDMNVTLPRLAVQKIKMTMSYQEPVIAPIKKGTRLGTLSVQLSPEAQPIELPLVAGEDVASLGFIARAFNEAWYAATGQGVE